MQEYASYNALARQSLMFGVPIITLMIFLLLMLLSGFGGVAMFGALGLIPVGVLFAGLFVIRIKCMSNTRAMEEVRWELKGAWLRLRCRASVVSFTAFHGPITRRKHHVREWFKHHSHR